MTGSLGTSNVRLPSPSFTYTNTLARSPPETVMFSASFVPLQAGSWLMSILDGFGAVPSNFTVPLTVATVAGSMGVAAAAGAACSAGVLPDCSVFSFLLQAVSSSRLNRASMLTVIIAQHFVFVFMMSPFLGLGIHFMKKIGHSERRAQRKRRNLLFACAD